MEADVTISGQFVPFLRIFGSDVLCLTEIRYISDILIRFNNLLQSYYEEKHQLTLGLPTVQYCADKLCMSPNYFGEMFKKMTGDTASDHIRKYVIQLAKNGLAGGAPITQVAYELGFEYTQHFSRMFKKQTGVTPSAYCEELRNQ